MIGETNMGMSGGSGTYYDSESEGYMGPVSHRTGVYETPDDQNSNIRHIYSGLDIQATMRKDNKNEKSLPPVVLIAIAVVSVINLILTLASTVQHNFQGMHIVAELLVMLQSEENKP